MVSNGDRGNNPASLWAGSNKFENQGRLMLDGVPGGEVSTRRDRAADCDMQVGQDTSG